MESIQKLIGLITLEKVGKSTFMGQNYKAPWGRVFGGQVLAQSLHAAYQTVPKDRFAHSMHAYFILGGNLDEPIRYEVDEIRNGGSFTTRRVVAFQKNKAIFNMSASFQIAQKGVDHQIVMPKLTAPEKLQTGLEQIEVIKKLHPKAYERIKYSFPDVFTFKPVKHVTEFLSKDNPPYNHVWFKTTEKIDVPIQMQHQLLAYVSDYWLLFTSSIPHRKRLNQSETFYASIDHALWFHRDFKIEDWLMYAMDSPSASNARGFARGSIFNEKGVLVASVAQEGLIREGF